MPPGSCSRSDPFDRPLRHTERVERRRDSALVAAHRGDHPRGLDRARGESLHRRHVDRADRLDLRLDLTCSTAVVIEIPLVLE